MSLEAITDNIKRRNKATEKDHEALGDAPPVSTADISETRALQDAHRLPDERLIEDLSAEELATALLRLKIPGASASNTKLANWCVYAAYIAALRDDGGRSAVVHWMIDAESGETERDDD